MGNETHGLHSVYVTLCIFIIHCAYFASSYGTQEQLWFNVIYPEEVAYYYRILPAKDFGGIITRNYKHAQMVLAEPWHACSDLKNGRIMAGRVVMAVRGECSFVSKAAIVELYGAAALIITNNDKDDIDTWIEMSDDDTGRGEYLKIPLFYMLGKDGHKISQALGSSMYKAAVINILVNVTDPHSVSQPKWTLW